MTSERIAWRLRGELGGARRSFPLGPGVNDIGSAESNDVALPVRGVSRHHARLVVEGDGVVLEDLGSRNGTRANDAFVQRTRLASGDVVAFGPVELQIEEIDPDDAALALTFDGEVDEVTAAVSTTTGLTGLDSRLETVDALLTCLGDESWNASEAAAVLREALRARAVAFVEVCPEQSVVVLGASGEVSELGRVERLLLTGPVLEPGRVSVASLARDGVVVVSLTEESGSALALVAVEAEAPGADELLRLSLRLASALRSHQKLRAGRPPGGGGQLRLPPGFVAGRSPAMRLLYERMQPVLQGGLPVLLLGETGTGKEHLARALHLSSPRHAGPFVALNCAAIPAELLESELFGIRAGVATGVSERRGRLQLAAGGTLFLDEIGDMPLALQSKLLRALQEKEVQPVGGSPEPVDIRIVAATNSDLSRRISDGRFRSDLYYRIAGLELRVPPLRERREDVPALVEEFVRRYARESGRPVRGVTVKAMERLVAHAWPGNVRELEHEIRRLVYQCPPAQPIDSTMLSERLLTPPAAADGEAPAESLDLESNVTDLERRLIQLALHRSGGNQSAAAKLLGISRNGLAMKIRRYEIEVGFQPDLA